MHTEAPHIANSEGLLIRTPRRYDWLVWLFTLGRERRLRDKILRLAMLKPGERILDLGCGTGTLAMMAKEKVGPQGIVTGLDASEEMVVYAREKASRKGVDATFVKGTVQALPFGDGAFDAVVSTFVLHHIPAEARAPMAQEIRRVLKEDGRFLAVDFAPPRRKTSGQMPGDHHGHIAIDDVVADFAATGLKVAARGEVGERNLQFVLATPGNIDVYAQQPNDSGAGSVRGLPHSGLATLAAGAIALHIGPAAIVAGALGYYVFEIGDVPLLLLDMAPYVLVAFGLFMILHKLGMASVMHRVVGRFVGGIHRHNRGHDAH